MPFTTRNWKLKYLIEWIIAFLGVIILLPLFIIIALLEKISDGGSVFYISERVGKGGRPFKFYKFRGMVMGAQPVISNDFKYITSKNDSRITTLGKILRFGFDELPQLFNILKGDMCLIGPRPYPPWNLEWGEKQFNEREIKRLDVLPGITGLTQILGGRSLRNEETYEIDLRYIENSNLLTDFSIFVFTIPYCLGFNQFYKHIFLKYFDNIPSKMLESNRIR